MKSDVLLEYEETALLGCKAVREFLTYSGEKKEYHNRAKVGAVAMGSYSRLRATMNGEAQIRLIEKRLGNPDGSMPALPTTIQSGD